MIAHGYLQVTANIVFVARLVVQNMVRLTTTLSELSAQLRGVDAGKLAVDPTGRQVLMSGALIHLGTETGPRSALHPYKFALDLLAHVYGTLVSALGPGLLACLG